MKYPIRTFDYARIVRAIDGDTAEIEVDLAFSVKVKLRFRLANINTPERGQPGWQEATDFLGQFVDQPVTVHSTKLDKYGRYLAEIFIASPTGLLSINQMLLEKGLAVRYGA